MSDAVVEDLVALEKEAARRLGPMAYEYLASGAEHEVTLADNVTAWAACRLRPHVLRDVSTVDTSTSVLGIPVATPVLVAPTAMHGLFCDEGERATAAAATHAGTVMVASLSASTAVEDIAAALPAGHCWLQLYMQRDRGRTKALCERARDAGCTALVVTVDSPVLSWRPRNEAANFQVPPGMRLPNLLPDDGDVDIFGQVAEFDPAVTFDDLPRFTEWSGLPIVVKGVLRGDDAARCVDAGAAAVDVSNHGGRQLDGCIATADALADVVDAVAGRAEVYVDGGIRHGRDVVTALALGARAVLVGRPVLWGLATGGAVGAAAVLDGFTAGLARTMAFCGAARLDELTPDLVVSAPTA